jgi:hypothetical protein
VTRVVLSLPIGMLWTDHICVHRDQRYVGDIVNREYGCTLQGLLAYGGRDQFPEPGSIPGIARSMIEAKPFFLGRLKICDGAFKQYD